MKLHGMEVEGVDTCMLKEYLEKNYGYNEPIFINEIQLDGLSDNALRQYFKRMPLVIDFCAHPFMEIQPETSVCGIAPHCTRC